MILILVFHVRHREIVVVQSSKSHHTSLMSPCSPVVLQRRTFTHLCPVVFVPVHIHYNRCFPTCPLIAWSPCWKPNTWNPQPSSPFKSEFRAWHSHLELIVIYFETVEARMPACLSIAHPWISYFEQTPQECFNKEGSYYQTTMQKHWWEYSRKSTLKCNAFNC